MFVPYGLALAGSLCQPWLSFTRRSLLSSLFLLPQAVLAEQGYGYFQDESRFSFGQALAYLWETHPDVQAAENNRKASVHDIRAAYAGFIPYVAVDAAKGSRSDDYVARLIIPLYKGGATVASLDSAKASELGAVADLQRVRLQLGLRLADNWISLNAAQDREHLWRGYIGSLNHLQGVIQRRVEAGAAPQAEVLSATSRIQQADSQAAISRSELESVRAQLLTLLGLYRVEISWPDESIWLTDSEAEGALKQAGTEHPAIVFAETRVLLGQAESRVARAQLMPEIFLQHEKSFGEADPNNITDDESTRLVLRYQTDSGLKGLYSWRAGGQRVQAARLSVDAARREAIASVRVAQTERLASLAQLTYQRDAVNAADLVVQSFLRQFEVGRKTWLEVLNAQRELHETRLQLVQIRRTLWSAEIRLALHGMYWERLLREMDSPSIGQVPT